MSVGVRRVLPQLLYKGAGTADYCWGTKVRFKEEAIGLRSPERRASE